MLDRSIAPMADAIQKPKFPKLSKHTFAHGAILYSINQGTQPVIMMELVIPTSKNDGHPEVPHFVCKMMTEGTLTKTAEEIAEALDYYGSHLEVIPSLDQIYVRLYSLKKFFANQLALVEELLLESVFPEREFEINRSIRIQQLEQQQAKTSAMASLKFRSSLFGSSHPYGQYSTPELTETVVLEEVKRYYSEAFKSVPTVFLTGLISDAEIQLMEEMLIRLDFHVTPALNNYEISGNSGLSDPWKNAVQTSIRLGAMTIDKTHPDIHLLKITNDLFGGYFGSRLMKNIREEKGLTYGIHSSISHLKHASFWNVSTDVLKEKTDIAISEIKKEIQTLIDVPPSKAELETVINFSKGKFLMSFDTAFNSMGMIRNLILSGQDYSYWTSLLDKLDIVTPEEISETAGKYLTTDSICEVTVG